MRRRWSLLVVVLSLLAACSSGPAEVAAPEPPPATAASAPVDVDPGPTAGTDSTGSTVAVPFVAPSAAAEPSDASTGAVPAPPPGTDPGALEDNPVLEGPALTAAAPGQASSRSAAPAGSVQAAAATSAAKPASTGRIEIPAIGLNHLTYEGIDLGTLKYGPGHWPGTPRPGHQGNTVFPGHRTTNTRPFWDLDKLVPGNQVIFTTPEGRFTYRVTERLIVNAADTWVVNNTPDTTFTLLACHPKGSARQRVVIKGWLVGAPIQPPPPPPPAKAPPTTRPKLLGIL